MANKGKNRLKCQQYKSRDLRELNKVNKLKRHLKKFENDRQAVTALKKWSEF